MEVGGEGGVGGGGGGGGGGVALGVRHCAVQRLKTAAWRHARELSKKTDVILKITLK